MSHIRSQNLEKMYGSCATNHKENISSIPDGPRAFTPDQWMKVVRPLSAQIKVWSNQEIFGGRQFMQTDGAKSDLTPLKAPHGSQVQVEGETTKLRAIFSCRTLVQSVFRQGGERQKIPTTTLAGEPEFINQISSSTGISKDA